ncbi:hypothetical protein ACT3R9_15125, partial [Psychrobacter sp. AOP42-A1-21]
MSSNKDSEVTVTKTTESGGFDIQKITRPKRFLVHFRRPLGPGYDGSYGFDWLRDDYVYDRQQVLEEGNIPKRLYNGSKIGNLFKEYTRLKRSDAADLPEVREIKPLNQETYIPAWLAIFPTSNPINANGVDLHLQIDQESADGTEPPPLEDDGTMLTFETSTGIVVSPPKISLGKLITQKREDRELVSSVAGLSSKTVYYYKDESVKINIKATESYSEAGYVKVIATRKGKTRNVGLLMMYPNSVVPKAEVQIVEFGVVPYNKSDPFTYNVELPRNYKQAIETVSFNQALINAEVVADNIKLKYLEERAKYAKLNSLTADEREKKEAIEGLFNKYPSPEYPDKQIPSGKSLELV